MAEEKSQGGEPMSEGFRFKSVDHSGDIGAGAKRDPAGGKVASTGRFEFNVAGTDMAKGLAKQMKLDVESFVFRVAYDDETGLIGLYPEPFTAKGCAPVRRNAAKRTMTTYFHKAFDEAPSLRPVGTRHCPMTQGTDQDGNPCLVVSLFAALNRRVTPRVKSEEEEQGGKGGNTQKGKKGNNKGDQQTA